MAAVDCDLCPARERTTGWNDPCEVRRLRTHTHTHVQCTSPFSDTVMLFMTLSPFRTTAHDKLLLRRKRVHTQSSSVNTTFKFMFLFYGLIYAFVTETVKQVLCYTSILTGSNLLYCFILILDKALGVDSITSGVSRKSEATGLKKKKRRRLWNLQQ